MNSFSEIFGSLFTWDEPVARLRYFLNFIFIFLLMIPLFCLLVFFPEKSMFLKLFLILITLVYIYLIFTNMAKRIWDIVGDKKKGIYWMIGLCVFANIPVLGTIGCPIAALYLLFAPGKLA